MSEGIDLTGAHAPPPVVPDDPVLRYRTSAERAAFREGHQRGYDEALRMVSARLLEIERQAGVRS